ncbi:MAG: hypothetical protein ACK5I7_05665 [Anaerotignum sp.]
MEKKTISAHEINKYSYCPYQWYYEKLYGRKELRRRYKERMEALSLGDGTGGNFARGLEFHRKNYAKVRMQNLLWKIAMIVIGALVIYYFMRGGVNV